MTLLIHLTSHKKTPFWGEVISFYHRQCLQRLQIVAFMYDFSSVTNWLSIDVASLIASPGVYDLQTKGGWERRKNKRVVYGFKRMNGLSSTKIVLRVTFHYEN